MKCPLGVLLVVSEVLFPLGGVGSVLVVSSVVLSLCLDFGRGQLWMLSLSAC